MQEPLHTPPQPDSPWWRGHTDKTHCLQTFSRAMPELVRDYEVPGTAVSAPANSPWWRKNENKFDCLRGRCAPKAAPLAWKRSAHRCLVHPSQLPMGGDEMRVGSIASEAAARPRPQAWRRTQGDYLCPFVPANSPWHSKESNTHWVRSCVETRVKQSPLSIPPQPNNPGGKGMRVQIIGH